MTQTQDISRQKPGPTPSGPVSNRDFDFYYQGLREGRLLVQQCDACGAFRNPPGPACPSCQSFRWTARQLGGRGLLYAYTVHHHPPLPDFPTPLCIGLVTMAEGVRVLGVIADAQELEIGMALEAEFILRAETPGFQFRPARAVTDTSP